MAKLPLQEIPNWKDAWHKNKNQPEDLLERDKRYGRVYKIFDEEELFVVRVFLPKLVPNHPWIYQYGLSKELLPYDVQVNFNENHIQIKGLMQNDEIKPLCGLINSFPDRFLITLSVEFVPKNLVIQWLEEYIVDVIVKKK